MLFWKFLHIAFLFLAVGVAVGSDFIAHRVAGSRDVRAIRILFGLAKPIGLLIPVFFIAGAVFGIVTALTGKFDLSEGWQAATAIVFVIANILGGISGRWFAKVASAAQQSPDNAPSPELSRLLDDRKPRINSILTTVAVIVAVYFMVMKPF